MTETGDGELNEEEQAAAQAGKARRMKMLTARFDRDGDGKLSADESAAAWAWVEEDKRVTFQQFDKDGDGRLDEAERRAIRDRSGDGGKPGLPIGTAEEQ